MSFSNFTSLKPNEEIDVSSNDDTKIKSLGLKINNIETDIVFCDYSDKQLLILTQYQKIGTLISVTKGTANNWTESNEIFDITTICGLDSQEYHLAARYLAQQLNIRKPTIFSICLKDTSLQTLRIFVAVLKKANFLC